jgi:hypothetical protein
MDLGNNRPPSYLELAALSPTKNYRQISYSDSFLVRGGKGSNLSLEVAAAVEEPTIRDIDVKPPSHWPLLKEKALSIGLHVALIATFETLFFFQFVSGLADKGVVSVVDKYSNLLFGGCSNLTFPDRLQLLEVLDSLANKTGISLEYEKAIESRRVNNGRLLMGTWLFTGGLYAAWAITALLLRKGQPWTTILLENVAMISVLAVYEAVFVNVVVLNYDSITVPEIDQLIFNNAYAACI